MTRKVTLTGLVAAALMVPMGGSAAAAPTAGIESASNQQITKSLFRPLTGTTARRLAVKLAREVARDRDVRWWQLSNGRRLSRTKIEFEYADRTRSNTYCTSTILVSQPTARFRETKFTDNGTCRGVPAEALAVESATARFIRAAQGRSSELRRSIDLHNDQLADCEEVRIPRNRLEQVRALFLAHEVASVISPLVDEIGGFVRALDALQLKRPDLANAPRAWEAMLAAEGQIRYQFNVSGTDAVCDEVRRWARNGWDPQQAPANQVTALAQARAAERAIIRVARSLAALGVSPRAAAGFTPAGLVELAAPQIITCRSTRELTAAQGCQ